MSRSEDRRDRDSSRDVDPFAAPVSVLPMWATRPGLMLRLTAEATEDASLPCPATCPDRDPQAMCRRVADFLLAGSPKEVGVMVTSPQPPATSGCPG
jgi:hypothetical protein